MSEIDTGDNSESTEQVVSEEATIQDTLRDTLRNLGNPQTTQEEDAPIEKNTESSSVAPVTADAAPEKTNTIAVDATDALPNTWKKDASDAWKKADPVLRAEVQRREADFHKGIEQYRQAADFARTVGETITPYHQTLQTLGISPQQAIKAMFDADHKLRYSAPAEKAMHLAQLAKSYGIDLNTVVQSVQNTDPRIYDLTQQNQMLQQQFQQHQQAIQQQTEQQLNSHIATFAADPAHTHFEAVKLHMAALLQAGQAKDLNDAYEQAIYANPTTRAAVLQQQAQIAREESTKKAQAAKQASSVNLRSVPALPVKEAAGTLQDTIRETYRRLATQL